MDPRDELAEQARAAARRLGKSTLTLKEFTRETGLGRARVFAHFESWRALCRHAGLDTARYNDRISDDALFGAMHDAFMALGGVTTFDSFGREFRYGGGILRRRGLNWKGAKRAFRLWAEANAPDFPYLDQLPDDAVRAARRVGPAPNPDGAGPPLWAAHDGRALGDNLNFRALQHAPVNEHGVIMLFAMVAAELGYLVETVAPGFPDCEAKRLIGPGRWQRVRIEFEYRSRNFRHHGHDPARCDMIVCWEDNWRDCPLEVLALNTAIATLPAVAGGAEGEPRRRGDAEQSRKHED